MGKPRPQPDDLILRLSWRQPAWSGAPRGQDDCLARALKTLLRSYGFKCVEIRDAEPAPAQEEQQS